jgi:hypothetical protein
VAAGLSSGALAQNVGFSGKWSFSGLIIASPLVTSFAQICDLQQTGTQVAGACRGPNGGCSAVGVVDGGHVDLTCRLTVVNNPNLEGVLTFHGDLQADGIVRGACTHSRSPGSGAGAMMRI